MMNNDDFIDEITSLIDIGTEGGHWDFKQQWHENNADLLHDIICMANNLENLDAYIIIGVTEDTENATTIVTGVPAENRKNQQNLIDFLKDKKFAGGLRPTVYVQTIFCPSEIDVVIVKNSTNTPYYLIEQFNYGKECVRAGHIYVRIGDTNTPKTSIADIDKVEYLWRKRFGIDLSIQEKLLLLLDNPKGWQDDFKNSDIIYHKIYPEFQIIIESESDDSQDYANNSIVRNIADHECDTSFDVRKIEIRYHATVIFTERVIYLDGYRILIPFPDTHSIYINGSHELEKSLTYLYFNKSSVSGKLYLSLTEEWYSNMSTIKPGHSFLYFNDDSEQKAFDKFVKEQLPVVLNNYTKALKDKKIQNTPETQEYFYYGWSKANEIKSWYLYNLFLGTNTRNLEDYLPSYLSK